jgi:two-component system response regulator PfeR
MHYLCLIVDPVADTARALERELPAHGFRPHIVDSAHAGSLLLQQWRFDAVLLDTDGSRDDPIEAMRKLRRRSSTPVTLLARAATDATQVAWFEAGAHDVMRWPASTQLLATRLRRWIEAGAGHDDDPVEFSIGPLTLNTRRCTALVDGQALALTVNQFELLYALATRHGCFVHREAIAIAVRSPAMGVGRAADVQIYRIRKKLRALGISSLRLDTVHGRGYCLTVEASGPTRDHAPAHAAATWTQPGP